MTVDDNTTATGNAPLPPSTYSRPAPLKDTAMAEPSPPAAAAAEAAQHILMASSADSHENQHDRQTPAPEEKGPAATKEASHDDDENDENDAAPYSHRDEPASTSRPQSALPSDRRLRLAESENRQLRDEVERMQREIASLRGRMHPRGPRHGDNFDENGNESNQHSEYDLDDSGGAGTQTPPRSSSSGSTGAGSGVGKLGKALGRKLARRSSPMYESVSVVESPEKAAVHHRRGGGNGHAAEQDVEAGRGGGGAKRGSSASHTTGTGVGAGRTRKAKLSDTEEDDHGRDSFADHDLHPVNIDGSMVSSPDRTEMIGNGVDGDTPFRDVVKDRAGWLVGLLVLQSCSSFILARNEALLESHLVIVQFLTMLVGAGGNAGNQASVRVIRGLAVGTLNERTLRPFLWTEAKMGLALSAILGLAGFLRATVFMVPIAETVAITTSLYMIVVSSVCIGALLPLAMYRCGLDPAHSSTTIQVLMDILGVTMTVWVSGAILNTGVGPALTAFFHHGVMADDGAEGIDAGGDGSSGDDLMEGVE